MSALPKCFDPEPAPEPIALADLLHQRRTELVFITRDPEGSAALRGLGLLAIARAVVWSAAACRPLIDRDVILVADDPFGADLWRSRVASALESTVRRIGVWVPFGMDTKNTPANLDEWVVRHLARGFGATAAAREAAACLEDLMPAVPPPDPTRPLVIFEPAEPSGHATDLGNGERLVFQHGRKLRHIHTWSKWLVWDGLRWVVDATAVVRRWAKESALAIYDEARACSDADRRQVLMKWAIRSEGRDRISAMIEMAASERGIPILPEALDRHPWLLNVRTGTIDLRTGKLRPARPDDFITKVAPVDYDSDATCPTWEACLRLWLAGNEGLIRFVRQVLGMSLTGDVGEQVLVIFHGAGENGKSTLLNAVLEMLGADFGMKAPSDFLMARRHEAHPTERADLHGKRLVVASETGEGARLNEALVKELTGSDLITARRMREDFWTFAPTHKLIIATNHRPVIRGTDHAIWRRIRLVPFDVKIPAEMRDRLLPQKLTAERPGILNWCVRGCLDWQANGLVCPDEVIQATSEYREDEDVLGKFLAECCVENPELRAKSSALYAAYKVWTEGTGENAINQNRFGKALVERGFEKLPNNGIWYRGLGLRQNSDEY